MGTPMQTSAEQIHHGTLNRQPTEGSDQRLYVDLDLCESGECKECEIRCSYFYHPGNAGIVSVAELVGYALVCRQCEEPHCVAACPADALEQRGRNFDVHVSCDTPHNPTGVGHGPVGRNGESLLVRHNLRCVGCRSCSHACPYGTIYPELVPLLVSNCDFCLDRRGDGEPLCIASCPYGALALRTANGELGEDTFLVGDNLIVHSTHWMREKA